MGDPASALSVLSHPDTEAVTTWLFRNLRFLCEEIGAARPPSDTMGAMLSGMFPADGSGDKTENLSSRLPYSDL